MSIQNEQELMNTLQKLEGLERLYNKTKSQAPAENARVKGLTLRSLKQTMNAMQEEVARYRAQVNAAKAEA